MFYVHALWYAYKYGLSIYELGGLTHDGVWDKGQAGDLQIEIENHME